MMLQINQVVLGLRKNRKGGMVMATFVLLLKEYEDEGRVIYKFGPNEEQMGRIELNKKTNMFSELEPVSDQIQSSKFYFDRAAQRLARCVVKEKGVFPDKAAFES